MSIAWPYKTLLLPKSIYIFIPTPRTVFWLAFPGSCFGSKLQSMELRHLSIFQHQILSKFSHMHEYNNLTEIKEIWCASITALHKSPSILEYGNNHKHWHATASIWSAWIANCNLILHHHETKNEIAEKCSTSKSLGQIRLWKLWFMIVWF